MKQFEFCLLQSIKLQIMGVPHSLLISFKQLIKVSSDREACKILQDDIFSYPKQFVSQFGIQVACSIRIYLLTSLVEVNITQVRGR